MVLLDGESLSLEQLVEISDGDALVDLAPAARDRVDRARAIVDRLAAGEAAVYGVNTGFGHFAEVKIPPEALGRLQVNLLRSHAAGVGEPLPLRAVRATMALRANVLAKGFSGIRRSTIDALIALLNRRVHPLVPSRGSVGASGDLAPLAHLSLLLIGEGQAITDTGEVISGREALGRAGLAPIVLEPKEGLALINGTQPSAAVLALALVGAERLVRAADIAAAFSVDGLRGSVRPFDARVHEARPLPGQQESARNLRNLLKGSGILKSHEQCGRVQDAYSIRCAPQVHGAARDALSAVRQTLSTEINSATDNPMVFVGAEEGAEVVSCGNFHGAPLAVAADLLAIGLAQLATISERRCEALVNASRSGLPPFLTHEGGLQSGLMLAQVTAAALTSELKGLGCPASVDSIPTSADREDHVSMSMTAALKAERALECARQVIAVELLCGCQAIDLLAPLTTSDPLRGVHQHVRKHVPPLHDDRPPAPDIRMIERLIAAGELEAACGVVVK